MSTEITSQEQLDKLNAEYWNEPCGTHLARRTKTERNFEAFDREYLKAYPFLAHYLDKFSGRVLEVGIGYGTVAQYLHNLKQVTYWGMDIAQGPLDILTERHLFGNKGNVLSMVFDDAFFDGVVSIGCLHHTGDIQGALDEIYRVLKPGGRTLVMLYNAEADKLPVDRNTKGERAPHIEYTNVKDLPDLFWRFQSFRRDLQNGANKDIYIEAVK